jgi:hypothetical protein
LVWYNFTPVSVPDFGMQGNAGRPIYQKRHEQENIPSFPEKIRNIFLKKKQFNYSAYYPIQYFASDPE